MICGRRVRALAALVVAGVALSGVRSASAASRARAVAPFAAGCAVSPVVVPFPADNPLSTTASTFSGSLTLTCTVLLAFGTVALGTGNSNSFSSRLMHSGTNTISYNLYQDSGYATVWGDGTGTTKTEMIRCSSADPKRRRSTGTSPAARTCKPGRTRTASP